MVFHLVLISVGIPEKLCAHLGLNPGKEPCLRKFSIGMLYSGDALFRGCFIPGMLCSKGCFVEWIPCAGTLCGGDC